MWTLFLAVVLVGAAELVPLPDVRVAGLPVVLPMLFLLAAAAATAGLGLRWRHGLGLTVLVAAVIGVLAYADARTVPIHAPAQPALHGALIGIFVGVPILVGSGTGVVYARHRRHRSAAPSD